MPFRDWSPEEKAGQHLVVGFPGTAAPPSLLDRIRAGRVGGAILFKRNIESAEQTLDLTHALQRAAAASPRRVPLLITIDEEGGRVSRLSPDFTLFPAARVFGRIGDRGLAQEAARTTAAELRAVGVTMDLTPVLDLFTNPGCTVIGDRAFGRDPDIVGPMAAAVISGLQGGGVAAAAKHFPGIGDMAPDPHETLPYSDLTAEDLAGRELLPYRDALDPRLPGGAVAAVLVAHAVYRRIDADRPASLSPAVVRDMLRNGMPYRGLAITDDLEMGAIADPAEAAALALEAGEDIALICHEEEAQERAFERIAAAIREGRIPPEGEDASLQRILAVRTHYAEPIDHFGEKGHLARLHKERRSVVACDAHREVRQEVERLRRKLGEV